MDREPMEHFIPHEHTAQARVNREEHYCVRCNELCKEEEGEMEKLERKRDGLVGSGSYNISNIMEGLERLNYAMAEQGALRLEVKFDGGKVIWEKDEAQE